MLIFGLHDGERITLDVRVGMRVKEVRQMIQSLLNISVDQNRHDKKVLVLSWAGADLRDPWVFSDLGIVPGSTVRVHLKEEVKAVLFIHCSHSQVSPSAWSSLWLSVCLSVCLSVYLSVCLAVCLSVCLPVCLSPCLPVCLPVCLPAPRTR